MVLLPRVVPESRTLPDETRQLAELADVSRFLRVIGEEVGMRTPESVETLRKISTLDPLIQIRAGADSIDESRRVSLIGIDPCLELVGLLDVVDGLLMRSGRNNCEPPLPVLDQPPALPDPLLERLPYRENLFAVRRS